jgi:hypothetical protein
MAVPPESFTDAARDTCAETPLDWLVALGALTGSTACALVAEESGSGRTIAAAEFEAKLGYRANRAGRGSGMAPRGTFIP